MRVRVWACVCVWVCVANKSVEIPSPYITGYPSARCASIIIDYFIERMERFVKRQIFDD